MSGERVRVTGDHQDPEPDRFTALGADVTYDIRRGTQLDAVFNAAQYPDAQHDADYYTVPFAVVQMALGQMVIYPFADGDQPQSWCCARA